jgi:hypothetical protein
MQDFCFVFCFYGGGDGFGADIGATSCAADVKPFAMWVPLLPYWWRLAQCFRRHYDMAPTNAETQLLCFTAPKRHHHLHNALKYTLSMAVVVASVYDKEGAVWMFFAVVSTVYSCWWDFWYDWGLLRRGCKNLLLRDTLLYHSPAIYYVCMLLNMALRCVWVLTISPGINFDENHKSLQLFFFGALEILRRCMWNIFRVENEQLHNVGEFRAIKAVPLPDIGKRHQGVSSIFAKMRRMSHVAPVSAPVSVPPEDKDVGSAFEGPLTPVQTSSKANKANKANKARQRSTSKEGQRQHQLARQRSTSSEEGQQRQQ